MDNDRWLETGRLAEVGLRGMELVHELRQPVFALRAMVQLLERRLASPAEREMLAGMLDQLTIMEQLVERYSGSGKRPQPDLKPVLLPTPVEAGVALLQPRARQSQKSLVLGLSGQPAEVNGDPVSIQQITANLVANALDAARERVTVEVDGFELRVQDDGPGIPAELQQRIFEPFFSTKPAGQGTGLGLSIAGHLVQNAGGSIHCDSSATGTVFVVRFRPVLEAEIEVPPAVIEVARSVG